MIRASRRASLILSGTDRQDFRHNEVTGKHASRNHCFTPYPGPPRCYFFTVRSMLHFGHLPGALCTTSGWCAQVYWLTDSDVVSAFLHPVRTGKADSRAPKITVRSIRFIFGIMTSRPLLAIQRRLAWSMCLHVLLGLFDESRFATFTAKAVSLALVFGARRAVFDSYRQAGQVIIVPANFTRRCAGACFPFRRWRRATEHKTEHCYTCAAKKQSHRRKR